MGGLAQLAVQLGHRVSGSDANVYPPMSTQLEAAGIPLRSGYDPAHLQPPPDLAVVGNALSRGNPAVEYLLNEGLPYVSGPQWLGEHVLRGRWVLAVAGTHGKTTCASMLAWILDYAGLEPGFLIGGVPENFGVSARLGSSPFFVVEADEYDSAFFDKRSKFVHYHPRTLVLNNLEYDHADIFPDLGAIQQQFHHLLRTVPGQGLLVTAREDTNLAAVLARGCWTPVEYFDGAGATWTAHAASDDGGVFDVRCEGRPCGQLRWTLLGRHNVHNALGAIAAARHAGVPTEHALAALAEFRGVQRRMQVRGQVDGVTVYDDFAHHPTAISTTLEGLRARVGPARVIAVLEPRSNTMRLGVHRTQLAPALSAADQVYLYRPVDLGWDLGEVAAALGAKARVEDDLDALVALLAVQAAPGDHIVIMSNGGFGGIHAKLLGALRARAMPDLADAR